MSKELLPVTKPVQGRKYHIAGKGNGAVWVLTFIDGKDAVLRTPTTYKRIVVPISKLRHLRATQANIEGIKGKAEPKVKPVKSQAEIRAAIARSKQG